MRQAPSDQQHSKRLTQQGLAPHSDCHLTGAGAANWRRLDRKSATGQKATVMGINIYYITATEEHIEELCHSAPQC